MRNIFILIILFSGTQIYSQKNTTNFSIGGFAKMDAMITVVEGGELTDPESPLRDIHLPSAIPIGGRQTYDTHMHIKESRFYSRIV